MPEINTLLINEDGTNKHTPDDETYIRLSLEESRDGDLLSSSNPIEKSFTFPDFGGIGYGELVRITMRLVQISEGTGIAYLTFTQNMRCRRSDRVKGPDLKFLATLYDSHGVTIRQLQAGYWDRRCGNHFVELRSDFTWIPGSINPVTFSYRIDLKCTFFTRVHSC